MLVSISETLTVQIETLFVSLPAWYLRTAQQVSEERLVYVKTNNLHTTDEDVNNNQVQEHSIVAESAV